MLSAWVVTKQYRVIMNILIIGAGHVGATLAENLAHEQNNITIIDTREDILHELQDRLDIRTIAGHGGHPEIQRQAGIEDMDMIIAVTDTDEDNMIACQVAYSLFQTPTKIARIHSRNYLDFPALFTNKAIPIDFLISPERLVTHNVRRLIEHPGALQVLDFADSAVQLVAVKPHYSGHVVGKSLAALYQDMQGVNTRVAAIYRNNESVPLTESTLIESNDEIFFIAPESDIQDVLNKMQRVNSPYRRVMIAGGGNIGFCLALALEQDFQVKIIDHNRERANFIAQRLDATTVLWGDSSDRQLLVEEGIDHMDVFCAVTNDDEANIMSCLQAKRLGVRHTVALITRTAYVELIEGEGIDIDAVISPQQATIGSILTHIRRGDVVNVHSLRRGAAEAIEAVAHGDRKTSKVVGRAVGELKLPSGATIVAIVREGQVLTVHPETMIASKDHIVMFLAEKRRIREVERLFQVDVSYFE